MDIIDQHDTPLRPASVRSSTATAMLLGDLARSFFDRPPSKHLPLQPQPITLLVSNSLSLHSACQHASSLHSLSAADEDPSQVCAGGIVLYDWQGLFLVTVALSDWTRADRVTVANA